MLAPTKLTRARRDGLILVLIGGVVFVLLGIRLESTIAGAMVDFRTAYFSARCLIQQCDPYNPSDVLRLYQESGQARPTDTPDNLFVITRNVYPPPEYAVTAPFALLPYGLAQGLWIALLAGGLILASILIWKQSAGFAPGIAGCLACYFLVNCASLLLHGNPAGVAVGLCVLACCCFVQHRFVPVGVVCLAVSLALKPQDAGLVWLYFLLAGGRYRRYSLQTLALIAIVSVPSVLWIAHLSPDWIHELSVNLQAFTIQGGVNDPGPTSGGGHGGAWMITDLQAVVSFFRDDPRFYNPVSCVLCAPLLLVWGYVTVRSSHTPPKAWFALAAIAPLTMLPVYHRQYDAKLVLLTVPACAILWAGGKWAGKLALALNLLVFSVIGDFPWAVVMVSLRSLHQSNGWISDNAVNFVLAATAPLVLLAMAVFYLWVYASHATGAVLTGAMASLDPPLAHDRGNARQEPSPIPTMPYSLSGPMASNRARG